MFDLQVHTDTPVVDFKWAGIGHEFDKVRRCVQFNVLLALPLAHVVSRVEKVMGIPPFTTKT
jgi:hypothetical protein